MPQKTTIAIITVIVLVIIISLVVAYNQNSSPRAPSQTNIGPGSSEYKHQVVKETVYGSGEDQYWIFEPASPTPESAPVIVFNHGWGAINPIFYRGWIEHLVKRGNIVVYPRYQVDIFTPSDNFTINSINATQDAFRRLKDGSHVKPELDNFALIGHSAGGLISVNMAALAIENNLPLPKAVFAVQPGKSRSSDDTLGPILENLSKIPSDTLLLTLAGDQDTWVDNQDAIRIIQETTQIPSDNKDYILMVSDNRGQPELVADHFAPLSGLVYLEFFKFTFWTDARDYYGTWKLFDGLIDGAFYKKNKEFALGNTTQQRFMGTWSDGTPVKELVVQNNP
jgi:dienelactone hydrolase